ncbi:MAG: hypothetical protein RLZZ455_465 [Candidatus Parcubacteria bacterium]
MRKKRALPLLLVSILSLIAILFVIFLIPPTYAVALTGIQINILFFFLPLLFIFTYSLLSFVFQKKTHGILAGIFLILYLILRLGGFTHPLFLLILLALLLILELLFVNKSPKSTTQHRTEKTT